MKLRIAALAFATVLLTAGFSLQSFAEAAPTPQPAASPTPQPVAAPDPTPTASPSTPAEQEEEADLARIHKNYDKAIGLYQKLLRNDKNNATLWNKLGVTELRQGDLRQARKSFERALKNKPEYTDALNNLAAVYILQKKYDTALVYMKKALSLEETRAVFHLNIGEIWFGKGQYEYALTEYARALELDPDILQGSSSSGVVAMLRTREQQATFAYLMAKTYARRGNLGEALVQLKRARELGYRELGNVYKDQEFAPLWKDPRLKPIVGM